MKAKWGKEEAEKGGQLGPMSMRGVWTASRRGDKHGDKKLEGSMPGIGGR